MERKKHFKILIGIFLILFCHTHLKAQEQYQEIVYRAYIFNQMDQWDKVIGDLYKTNETLELTQSIELINYYYGYIGWAIAEGLNKKAKAYLKTAKTLVNELIELHPEEAVLYAYKGAFIGFQIGLNKIKAVVLGPESLKNIDHSIELDSMQYQGWIEKGNALFYMPKMFGGSKVKALDAYTKALKIMEQDPDQIQKNWMYLNLLLIIGQSYDKTGQFELAKDTYDKTLQQEPNFMYLRDELYPSFIERYTTRK
jgi:tetratricopeptide (TPR) repeat protein